MNHKPTVVIVKHAYAIGRDKPDGYEFVLRTITEKKGASWNHFLGYLTASDPGRRRTVIRELKAEGWECVAITITRKDA